MRVRGTKGVASHSCISANRFPYAHARVESENPEPSSPLNSGSIPLGVNESLTARIPLSYAPCM